MANTYLKSKFEALAQELTPLGHFCDWCGCTMVDVGACVTGMESWANWHVYRCTNPKCSHERCDHEDRPNVR